MIVAEIRSFSDHGNNISGEKVSDYRNRDVDLAIIDCIYLVLLRPQLIASGSGWCRIAVSWARKNEGFIYSPKDLKKSIIDNSIAITYDSMEGGKRRVQLIMNCADASPDFIISPVQVIVQGRSEVQSRPWHQHCIGSSPDAFSSISVFIPLIEKKPPVLQDHRQENCSNNLLLKMQ